MGSNVLMPVNSSHSGAAGNMQWGTHLLPCEVYHSNQAWWLQKEWLTVLKCCPCRRAVIFAGCLNWKKFPFTTKLNWLSTFKSASTFIRSWVHISLSKSPGRLGRSWKAPPKSISSGVFLFKMRENSSHAGLDFIQRIHSLLEWEEKSLLREA